MNTQPNDRNRYARSRLEARRAGAMARMKRVVGLCALTMLLAVGVQAQEMSAAPVEPPSALEVWFADLPGFPDVVQVAGLEHRSMWIYHSGLIAFGERPGVAIDSPVALHRGLGQMVAPLWNPMGGACQNADMGQRNQIEVHADVDGLTVVWRDMTRRRDACSRQAPTSTFAAHLSWSGNGGDRAQPGEGDIFRAVFDYTFDDELVTEGEVRVGAVLGDAVIELLPDEGKPRTDRASALVSTGSGDAPGDMREPGIWIIEVDSDGRLVGDDGDGLRSGDNCPRVPNVNQRDLDGDSTGDACDLDMDGDELINDRDNCPWVFNLAQVDTDGDRLGDACDKDDDDDRVLDVLDNCRLTFNPGQFDQDRDHVGDSCDHDPDGDGYPTAEGRPDVCPWLATGAQLDKDGDGAGDACDVDPRRFSLHGPSGAGLDSDGDGLVDPDDNCPFMPNPRQPDTDGDGLGDTCDPDLDGDGRLDIFQGRCFSSALGLIGDCRIVDLPAPWPVPEEPWW